MSKLRRNCITGNCITGNCITGNCITGNCITGNCITAILAALVGLSVGCGGVDHGIDVRAIECDGADEIALVDDGKAAPELAPLPVRALVGVELKRAHRPEPQQAMRLADEQPEVTTRARPTAACIHDDTVYRPGQVYPLGDGCNVCLCHDDGGATCTLVDC